MHPETPPSLQQTRSPRRTTRSSSSIPLRASHPRVGPAWPRAGAGAPGREDWQGHHGGVPGQAACERAPGVRSAMLPEVFSRGTRQPSPRRWLMGRVIPSCHVAGRTRESTDHDTQPREALNRAGILWGNVSRPASSEPWPAVACPTIIIAPGEQLVPRTRDVIRQEPQARSAVLRDEQGAVHAAPLACQHGGFQRCRGGRRDLPGDGSLRPRGGSPE